MIQKATYESVVDAAMNLDPAERCRVAARLWESVGTPMAGLEGEELEEMLDQRETELDEDPSREISHEEFMAAFTHRRRS